MQLKALLMAFSVLCWPLGARAAPISAERQPGERWEDALRNALADQGSAASPDNAWNILEEGSLRAAAIPEWSQSRSALQKLFGIAKQARLYANPNPGDYRRRGAWYYVDDGCYSKAAHVSYLATKNGYPAPGKIFAYGNLRFHSRYARNGSTAYWSYHVAAAYRMGSTVYVIDPEVSSSGVLTQREWLHRISPHPKKLRILLCDTHAYAADGACRGGNGNGAFLGDMDEFLRLEWANLSRLGISPPKLLAP